MNNQKLKPCPFCGNEFLVNSYDRKISFTCEHCGYTRGFKGLLQNKPDANNIVRVPHADSNGDRIPYEDEQGHQMEYYHKDAYEVAYDEMNKRVSK